MARARNIKPAIMDNDELAELEPLTRLLFIYLWMLADREGRLKDQPRRIAGKALPYDRTADVDSMLEDLQRGGFIKRYTSHGLACIQIIAFHKHQTPHVREAASDLPGPEQGTTKAVPATDLDNDRTEIGGAGSSPRSPDSGFSDSGSLIPDSGLGTPCASAHEELTAGSACKAMRRAGLADVNPSHPTLKALIDAGITLGELVDAAKKSAEDKKPFAYALAVAEGRRREAAAMAPLPKAQPTRAQTARQAHRQAWNEALNKRPHQGENYGASDDRTVDTEVRFVG